MPILHLDDLPLFYQVLREGEETLLALHPSTVSGSLFQWAVPKDDKFRVLLPDQRGHGKTPNPAGHLHMTQLVDDMQNFVDMLEVEAFHAIGYSMGGTVLLGMAQREPERFLSLVIIGSNHRPPTDDEFSAIAGPLEERKGLAYEIMHPERGLHVGWGFPLADFVDLKCPVTIISGDRDPVSQPTDVLQLYDVLPNGRLLIVPDCGHFGYHSSPVVQTFLQGWYDSL